MRFTVNHETRIGGRKMNQDRLGWAMSDEALLMVVCDGMGGHRHGEIAAQIVVDQLLHVFRQTAQPRVDDPRRFLQTQIVEAHRTINRYAGLRAIVLAGAPRTTCVACLIQDGEAWIAHTGDSRAYLIRDGRVVFRTLDHSHVQRLVDAGEISEAEAQTHPQRNIVFTCLGGENMPRIDISAPHTLLPGDTVALCSDGVWGPLGEALPAVLSYPLERALPGALDRAQRVAGDSADNLSLLALRWETAANGMPTDERTLAHTQPVTIVEDFTRTLPTPLSDAEIAAAIASVKDAIEARGRNTLSHDTTTP